jgi:arsenate reductase-like glutaredoxin family protein
MTTITIYGIKNCDTMKKARGWLDSHGVAYGFHDYKTEGVAKDKLKRWSDELGSTAPAPRFANCPTATRKASTSARRSP